MYSPPYNRVEDRAELIEFMRANNFPVLVTGLAGKLLASHLPATVHEEGEKIVLDMHMAFNNPQWSEFLDEEVLVIFTGPHAYISPRWYEEKERVPTWNYTAVHAYGVPSIVADPARVRAILDRTVQFQEDPPPGGWSSERLPAEFVTRMAQGVVAFELPITRLEGKWKLGQNRPTADVDGARAGLRATGDPVANQVAELMARPAP
jgi:transcriptional regulator